MHKSEMKLIQIPQCKFCKQRYDLNGRKPKELHLTRILCLNCLENLPKNENKRLKSPFDNTEIAYNDEMLFDDTFSTNVNIMNLLLNNEFVSNSMKFIKIFEDTSQLIINIDVDLIISQLKNEIETKLGCLNENSIVTYKEYLLNQECIVYKNRISSEKQRFQNTYCEILNNLKATFDNLKTRFTNLNPTIELQYQIDIKQLIDELNKLNKNLVNLKKQYKYTFNTLVFELKSNQIETFFDVPITSENLASYREAIGEIKYLKPIEKFVLLKEITNDKFKDPWYIGSFKMNNHFVITDWGGYCIHIYDQTSCEYVKSVDIDHQMGNVIGICDIPTKHNLYIVDNKNVCVYLLNANYELVKKCNLKTKSDRDICGIAYNSDNNLLYVIDNRSYNESVILLNENLDILSEHVLKLPRDKFKTLDTTRIYVHKNHIYINDDDNYCYHIFSALNDMQYKTSFGFGILTFPREMIIDRNEYIMIIDFEQKCIQVFSSIQNNFDYVKKINIDDYLGNFTYGLILSNNRFVIGAKKKLVMLEIIE